jgi:hypothetical protein
MYTDSITTYGVEFKFYHNTGETTNESWETNATNKFRPVFPQNSILN